MKTGQLGIGVVLAVALTPALVWAQDHVFVGSHGPNRIDVYRSATGAVNDTSSAAGRCTR